MVNITVLSQEGEEVEVVFPQAPDVKDHLSKHFHELLEFFEVPAEELEGRCLLLDQPALPDPGEWRGMASYSQVKNTIMGWSAAHNPGKLANASWPYLVK